MNIKSPLSYFSNAKNIPSIIFYLIGFVIACYAYSIKTALLLILFALSIVVIGFYISEIFIFIRGKENKFDKYKITSTSAFIIFVALDILLFKLVILLYVAFLSFVIAFIGIYFGLKSHK